MFESQWKPRTPVVEATVITSHPACRRDPAYWDGYDDGHAGRDFSRFFLGKEDLEAEEYRAGYLQACAEDASKGKCPPVPGGLRGAP